MKNKKAQMGTLQTVIITIMIIGIMLGIGFLLLQEFQDTLGTDSNSVNNETITLATAGSSVVHNVSADSCFNTFSVVLLDNLSDGAKVVPTNNYSYEAYSGRIIGTSDSAYIGESVNVSYSYLHDASNSTSCSAITDTETAIQTIPTWLTIIVIMFIVGILLAIVFRVLPRAGGEGTFSTSGRDEGGVIAEI